MQRRRGRIGRLRIGGRVKSERQTVGNRAFVRRDRSVGWEVTDRLSNSNGTEVWDFVAEDG